MGAQLEIGDNGEMVTISLTEYEKLRKAEHELKDICKFEQHLTRMFDSDTRVGLTILERIRKVKL